jgi:hypothetical protein
MKQSTRLTLGILKTLYPEADFDAAGEGFAMACTNEDARKLMEYSNGWPYLRDAPVRYVLGVGQLLPLHGHVCEHF